MKGLNTIAFAIPLWLLCTKETAKEDKCNENYVITKNYNNTIDTNANWKKQVDSLRKILAEYRKKDRRKVLLGSLILFNRNKDSTTIQIQMRMTNKIAKDSLDLNKYYFKVAQPFEAEYTERTMVESFDPRKLKNKKPSR